MSLSQSALLAEVILAARYLCLVQYLWPRGRAERLTVHTHNFHLRVLVGRGSEMNGGEVRKASGKGRPWELH